MPGRHGPYVGHPSDIYTVSHNKDTDLARYNFHTHQTILIIFDRNVGEFAMKQDFCLA